MKITLKDRQTLFDAALQYSGDVEAAFEAAEINGVSLSDTLPVGTELEFPDPTDSIARRVADYYRQNHITPATEATDIDSRQPIVAIDGEPLTSIRINEPIYKIFNHEFSGF